MNWRMGAFFAWCCCGVGVVNGMQQGAQPPFVWIVDPRIVGEFFADAQARPVEFRDGALILIDQTTGRGLKLWKNDSHLRSVAQTSILRTAPNAKLSFAWSNSKNKYWSYSTRWHRDAYDPSRAPEASPVSEKDCTRKSAPLKGHLPRQAIFKQAFCCPSEVKRGIDIESGWGHYKQQIITNKEFNFLVMPLRDLKKQAEALEPFPGPACFNVIKFDFAKPEVTSKCRRFGDIGALQANPQNIDTAFQVASRFGCIEGMGDKEGGDGICGLIGKYAAQGEEAVISAPRALAWRRYGVGFGYRNLLKNIEGCTVNLTGMLEKASPIFNTDINPDDVYNNACVGIHAHVGVLTGLARLHYFNAQNRDQNDNDCNELVGQDERYQFDPQRIHQIFVASLDFRDSHGAGFQHNNPRHVAFAKALLKADYEGTIYAAAAIGAQRVMLTLVGGSAFANLLDWIDEAIQGCVDFIEKKKMQVTLVIYENFKNPQWKLPSLTVTPRDWEAHPADGNYKPKKWNQVQYLIGNNGAAVDHQTYFKEFVKRMKGIAEYVGGDVFDFTRDPSLSPSPNKIERSVCFDASTGNPQSQWKWDAVTLWPSEVFQKDDRDAIVNFNKAYRWKGLPEWCIPLIEKAGGIAGTSTVSLSDDENITGIVEYLQQAFEHLKGALQTLAEKLRAITRS